MFHTDPALAARTRLTRQPAASLRLPARVAAATALVLGFALHTASLMILREGAGSVAHGSDLEAFLSWVAQNPTTANVTKTLDVLFIPLAVASVAVFVMLGRHRSRRLAWIGGVLYAGGLVCLAAMEGYEAFAYQMAIDGTLSPSTLTSAFLTSISPAYAVAQTLFLVGLLIGLPVTAASLWRSREVPRWTAVALVLFLVGELVGMRIQGHVIALAGACAIAWAILRAPRRPAGNRTEVQHHAARRVKALPTAGAPWSQHPLPARSMLWSTSWVDPYAAGLVGPTLASAGTALWSMTALHYGSGPGHQPRDSQWS